MPVPMIPCRNKVTGATAEVPETALQHMTDWIPIKQPGLHASTDAAWSAPADEHTFVPETETEPEPDPDKPASAPAPAKPPAKSKAADTATTEPAVFDEK